MIVATSCTQEPNRPPSASSQNAGSASPVAVVVSNEGPRYSVSLVRADGRVLASTNAAVRSVTEVPNPYDGSPTASAQLPEISASGSRVYFLDGNSTLRFLRPDGRTGVATQLPGSAKSQAGFAISPDDKRIAVSLIDFSQALTSGTRMRLYVEDLGGGHRIELLSSESVTEWPIGWTAGKLVVAVGQLNLDGPEPYGAMEGYQVVDPVSGRVMHRICAGGITVGPPAPAGISCEDVVVDWDGHERVIPDRPKSACNGLSPAGSLLACGPNPGVVIDLRHGQSRTLPADARPLGWVDEGHLIFTYSDPVSGSPPLHILDVGTGTITPVGKGGLVFARLPGGLGTTPLTSPSDMGSYRRDHSATLLKSGKVLVAGGLDADSAEIFDPVSKAWSPVASMHGNRAQHTATLLLDGRVLVVGGSSRTDPLAAPLWLRTAEIYDPTTGRWAPAAPMPESLVLQTATLLKDGRALVAGRIAGNGANRAEVYDPATNSWRRTSNVPTGLFGNTATRLLDGRVLVAPGLTSDGFAQATTALYDPLADRWSDGPSMDWGRTSGTSATLLATGEVLVVGYSSGGGPNRGSTAQIYDPKANTWTPVLTYGSNQPLVSLHRVVGLPNGKALAILDAPGGTELSGLIYSAGSRTWSTAKPIREPRSDGYSATLLPDGQILVAGGMDANGVISATDELYRP